MCYSAQIEADYRKYVQMFGAQMSIREFARLYWEREEGSRAKIPKAIDDLFSNPQSEDENAIKALIDRFNAEQATKLEQELFRQRTRLADAERTLQSKVTKAATESRRIANDKIEWTRAKLDDMQRTTPQPGDSRIFPGHYAPVLVMENGQRIIKPMRYQCRVAGNPRRTTRDTRARTTHGAIIWRASGETFSVTRMALLSSMRFTRMCPAPEWKAAILR